MSKSALLIKCLLASLLLVLLFCFAEQKLEYFLLSSCILLFIILELLAYVARKELALLYDSIFLAKQGKKATIPSLPCKASSFGQKIYELLFSFIEREEEQALQIFYNEEKIAELESLLSLSLEKEREREEEKKTIEKCLDLISGQIVDTCEMLSSSLRLLSKMISDLQMNVAAQRFDIEKTSKAMEYIKYRTIEASDYSTKALESASDSRLMVQQGQSEVERAVSIIYEVHSSTTELTKLMGTLGANSEGIGEIVSVISNLADQTNLLALNASIEAARAGDAGKGFAVVASEIKKLAEKTMNSTEEIKNVIKNIQHSASESIKAVETASELVTKGAQKANSASQLMQSIVERMEVSAEDFTNIHTSSKEQMARAEETSISIHEINTAASNSAESMKYFTSQILVLQGSIDDLELAAEKASSKDLDAQVSLKTIVNWEPSLETGIDLIDSQHKMLCAYINSLYRASLKKNSDKLINDLVATLRDYTVNHFATEEYYFSNSDYPDTENHKKIHQQFIQKVVDVEKRIAQGSLQVEGDLLEYLKDWLILHIKGTDFQYAKYVLDYSKKLSIGVKE